MLLKSHLFHSDGHDGFYTCPRTLNRGALCADSDTQLPNGMLTFHLDDTVFPRLTVPCVG